MNAVFTYNTLASLSTGIFKDRGSRFISYAAPVCSKEEIKKLLLTCKEEHPKASHHCYAYRLGYTGTDFRTSDDGEPSNSAGKPILGQLDSHSLTQSMIVVVRYFGGTLLGVPGLIHAYKEAAALAIASNTIVTRDVEATYLVEFEYPHINDVSRVMKQFQARVIVREELLVCRYTCSLSVAFATQFEEAYAALRVGRLERI